MPTPNGFRITQQVPGGEPVDLTEQASAATWSSGVPGGFGSAQVTIPRLLTQKERALLGGITIEHDGRVLFEGTIEDASTDGSRTGVSTEIQAFGLQRLLNDNSVRRIWSLRSSLGPQAVATAKGSSSGGALVLAPTFEYVFGRYDTSNPTLFGFRVVAGGTVNALEAGQVGIALPSGLTGVRVMFDVACYAPSGNWFLVVHSSTDGVTYTKHLEQAATVGTTVAVDLGLVEGAREIRIAGTAVGGTVAPVGIATATLEVSNLRVLGTGLREDVAGGFYGSTILRDVISFAPGIYPGTIENGTDLILAEIARVDRSTLTDVVLEVAKLYPREWGVWESGRFDWITPDLKSPGWLVPLESCIAWRIEQSLDGVAKRVYVTFTDAADGQQKEASADATSARNPYVRTGRNKDVVIPAPAAMTSITAPLLAAKLANDFGRWPDVKGSVTLPPLATIRHSNGSREIPALAIRAGDNVTIRDLPVEDIYAAGQDGQTVFHVTNVVASTDATVQLDLEGVTRRADVLLARLGR